jgi:hypothetical protein
MRPPLAGISHYETSKTQCTAARASTPLDCLATQTRIALTASRWANSKNTVSVEHLSRGAHVECEISRFYRVRRTRRQIAHGENHEQLNAWRAVRIVLPAAVTGTGLWLLTAPGGPISDEYPYLAAAGRSVSSARRFFLKLGAQSGVRAWLFRRDGGVVYSLRRPLEKSWIRLSSVQRRSR